MPAISIIIPVFNSDRFIQSSILSVLRQTFSDFELCIIDDGSTDHTLTIVERLQASDSRIRVLSRPNTGYVIALNELLEIATAPLVARMDADDICLPDRLAHQVAFMDAHRAVVASAGDFDLIDDRDRLIGRVQHPLHDTDIQAALLKGTSCLCHPAVIMRREAVLAAGGYRPDRYGAEDLDLWLRLGERGKLANIRQRLLLYRMHINSVSARHAERQMASARAALQDAYSRRGLPGPVPELRSLRSTATRADRAQMYVNWGWQSWKVGRWSTPLVYAGKALAENPLSKDSWRLLACGLLKRRPRDGAASAS